MVHKSEKENPAYEQVEQLLPKRIRLTFTKTHLLLFHLAQGTLYDTSVLPDWHSKQIQKKYPLTIQHGMQERVANLLTMDGITRSDRSTPQPVKLDIT